MALRKILMWAGFVVLPAELVAGLLVAANWHRFSNLAAVGQLAIRGVKNFRPAERVTGCAAQVFGRNAEPFPVSACNHPGPQLAVAGD
jgi:hypothetical protein